MGTTRVSTPIRGMRNVYGPSMRPAGMAVGSRDALLVLGNADVGLRETSGDAVVAGEVGAGDPTGVTSPLEPQAAVTATRASPAMYRASPRDAQQAGLDVVGSGVMQEAAAGNRRGSGHGATPSEHQTDQPGTGTSAG
jgi:hypothetical protein